MKKSSVIRTSSSLTRYDAESSVSSLGDDYISIFRRLKLNVCISDQPIERLRQRMVILPQYDGIIDVILSPVTMFM